MPSDQMLSVLYEKAFRFKHDIEALSFDSGELADRHRQVAIEKNKLIAELIGIRTDQIRRGIE